VEWVPEKHKEFPVLFKEMVWTFLLVNQRYEGTRGWLPRVMVYKIFNHCALTWPSDEEILHHRKLRDDLEREKIEKEEKQRLEVERKVKGKIELLEELFREGVIPMEVLSAKKDAVLKEVKLALLEQLKNDGSIKEEEFVKKIEELQILK